MGIEHDCPHCGKHLKIADKYAGQTGQCKGCGELIVVPSFVDPESTLESLSARLETARIDPDRPLPPRAVIAPESDEETSHAPRLGNRLRIVVVALVVPLAVAVIGLPLWARLSSPETNSNASKNGEVPTNTTPGARWTHPATGNQMIFVPRGYLKAREHCVGFATIGSEQNIFYAMNGLEFDMVSEEGFFASGFYMDRMEVSNQAYEKYVLATGAKPPSLWSHGKCPESLANCPVIVTLDEAREYAKWAKLDLPDSCDFRAALADKQGMYPWADDVPSMTIQGLVDVNNKSETPQVVKPCGANKEDVTPLGIVDIAGNAPEWLLGRLRYVSGAWSARLIEERDDAEGARNSKGDNLTNLQCLMGVVKSEDTLYCAAVNIKSMDARAGFRCVYYPRNIPFEQPKKNTENVKDTNEHISVFVKNALDCDVSVRLTSGEAFLLARGDSKTLHLLAGSYTIMAIRGDSSGRSTTFRKCLLPVYRSPFLNLTITWTIDEKAFTR